MKYLHTEYWCNLEKSWIEKYLLDIEIVGDLGQGKVIVKVLTKSHENKQLEVFKSEIIN